MASLSRRRRLFIITFIFNLILMSMSAPLGQNLRPPSLLKSLASPLKDSEVRLPEDLDWRLILVAPGGGNVGGELDSANFARKIKSIFIAPSFEALPACAEGYQADAMNRCVKNVNINAEAHLDFLVQQLNAMYENLGDKGSESSGSVNTGPLQLDLLNIPVVLDPEDSDEDEDVEEPPATSLPSPEEDKIQGEVDDNDKALFLGPQTTKDGSPNDEGNPDKYEGVVPIVDIVDDSNSSYSEVIDYKVESDEKLGNQTTSAPVEESSKKPSNESSLTPTVVLLLTPTKLPISTDLIVSHNTSTGKLSVRRDNKENGTAEEIISVDLPEHLTSAPIQIFINASTPDEGSSTPGVQSTTPGGPGVTEEPEETETDLPGEDDKDLEDIEESTESDDEILTHSEAGMLVTIPPRLQESSTADDKDTTASRISSEISINDDFVRETILLGLNVHKASNSTESDSKIITVTPEMTPDQETTIFHEDISSFTETPENAETTADDSEFTTKQELPVTTRVYESFSTDQRDLNPVIKIEEVSYDGETSTESPLTSSQSPEDVDSSEIMDASSSNNAEAIIHQTPSKEDHISSIIVPNTRKRVGSQSPAASEVKYVTSTISEAPEVFTEIRTMYDQDLQRVPEPQNVLQGQRKGPAAPPKDFVRFPMWDKALNRLGYVRFPSDEANSIHTPEDFKENQHHRPHQQGYRVPTKNRSSPYKISWPNDRRSIRSRSGVHGKPKDRSPMLFWNRMPLVRDPSLPEARSINYYEEVSSRDVPRAFARSTSLGG